MLAIGTIGAAMLWPPPPAAGLPPDGPLSFGDASTLLAWGLGGLMALSAAALVTQIEYLRQRVGIRRRLPAVRMVVPSRSRAGGTSGRVPPRPAAGSPYLRKL
jgi:hypothetical protein